MTATEIGQLTEEMRAELDRVTERMAGSKDLLDLPISEARELDRKLNSFWNVDMPHMQQIRRFVIPGSDDLNAAPCDAVVFRPHSADEGRILFVHGGGWCLCDLDTHERFMRVLAHNSRKEVVGIHYRLAPEHPFPAGLMDVISAYRAVNASPDQFGLSPGPLVMAGDSAGANLALAAMLHEVREGRQLPTGAMLFYGAFGMNYATASYQLYGDGYFLTQRGMNHFWTAYLPDPPMRANPLAVPLLASNDDLAALPPLFLLAAELDPLASDTVELKARLDNLGRNDSLIIEPGVVHAFLQMTKGLEAARKAVAMAGAAARHFITNARVRGVQ
jgi:acetyl esterase